VTIAWGANGAKKTIQLVRSSNPRDLVFQALRTGAEMSDHNILTRHIKPVAKRLGMGRVNWQVLRRSYATWLLVDGVDVKSVQGQMRHSTSKPTLDIYAQIVSASQRRAADNLVADLERCRNVAISTENCAQKETQLERELERNGSIDLCAVS
jgi:integrase